MRVLGIGPHPDDVEFLFGGTMAKYAKKGHTVTVATMTNGDKGSLTIPSEVLGKIRLEEAREAASVLGASHIWVGYRDAEVFNDSATVLKVVEVIRKVKPDIIITTSPLDYHPDHVNTSIVVVEAVFNAGVATIKTESAAHVPKRVFYCDTVLGLGFDPDFWVDITDFIEVKLRALKAHKSQEDWLKAHHGVDITDAPRVCSQYRGLQVGVKYAEAFQQVKKHMQISSIDLL